MTTNRIIIIGLGMIGRQLVQRLSHNFSITCIDKNAASAKAGLRTHGTSPAIITGDATSRLVLEEAGVADADTVIITMTKENANLEVARLLHEHFSARRVIALGITPSGIKTLERYGAEVENIFSASVVGILNKLERKARVAHGIGVGKSEIREVEIHPNSKLANKPLCMLASLKWRVGLIYRDDNIIVPGGETLLSPRDKVIILGEPAVLNTVSELLTFRFQNFPLEYGSSLLACVTGNETEGYFRELRYLLSVFPLDSILFAFEEKMGPGRKENCLEIIAALDFPATDHTTFAWKGLHAFVQAQQSAFGFVVLDRGIISASALERGQRNFMLQLSQSATSPVLLAAGTFPYDRAVVACVQGIDVTHVMEHVFEMAALLRNHITALLVEPSQYIAADDEHRQFQTKKKNILDLSSIYKLRAHITELHGNPVKAIVRRLSDYNLLLVDTSGWKRGGWFASWTNPDEIWRIVRASPVSTLLIPEAEEAF